MKFTYDSYKFMLENLKINGYEFATYYDWKEKHRPVILRHDVVINKNTELAAGTVVGGFTNIGTNSFVGLNATLKNRISIGENSFVGMGAAVMKAFPKDVSMIGNPAKGVLNKV